MFARLLLPAAVLLLLGASGAGSSLAAQSDLGWEGIQLEVSRDRLIEIEQQLASRLAAGGLNNRFESEVRLRLDIVRDRLVDGDFREGDRIVLSVRYQPGIVETLGALADTLTVMAGPMVQLPDIGDVGLRGVLASEIQPRMQEAVATLIRDPVVSARAMIQVAVSGEVGQPGFYFVTADALVSDIIMMAGGPNENADLDDVRIERGPWRPDAPEQRLDGISVDAMSVNRLGLRGGDQIVLEGSGISFGQILQWTSIVAGAAASIVILTGRR